MLSVAAAACAGLLLAASAAGRVWFAAGLAISQSVLVVGWFRAAGLTTRGQAAGGVVAVAGAVAADVSLLRAHDRGDVRALAAVLAAVVGAAFVVQLARRDGRGKLTEALAATIVTGSLALAGAVLLGVRGGRAGADVVAVALVAAAIAVLPVQPRVPPWLSLPVGVAIGVGVGVAIGQQAANVGTGAGSALAATAAVLALAGRVVAGSTASGQAPRQAALSVTATLPIALLAPAVLVVARVMVG